MEEGEDEMEEQDFDHSAKKLKADNDIPQIFIEYRFVVDQVKEPSNEELIDKFKKYWDYLIFIN